MSIASRIENMTTNIENAYNSIEDLGIDLTNINKNIENISTKIDEIYNNYPKITGEGTSINLDNTKKARLTSTLKGNTSQDGEPTPDSPIPVNVVSGDNTITIEGKNLFDKSIIPSANNNRRISTSNGGTYSSNGYTCSTYIEVQPSTDYALTTGITSYFCWFDENKTYITGSGWSNKTIVQSPNNAKFLRFDFETSNIDNVQLEKGSATSYEPYQGNTYNIDLPVENLCNGISQNVFLNYMVNQCGIASDNSGLYIPVSGGNYTISTTSTQARYRVACSNGVPPSEGSLGTYNGQNKDNTNSSITIDTTGYAYLIVNATDLTKIQIEKGSKQNTYTPYGTTPIELCKIGDYQDYFYKENDKWYLHKEIGKVVLDGSENWDIWASNTFYFDFNEALANEMCYCSHFIKVNRDQILTNGITFVPTNIVQINIYPKQDFIDNYGTLEGFKTWLGTEKPIVYYVLATPTTTEITDTTLISQLNALYNATSYSTQTNINQTNNDLPFIISASALKGA